MIERIVKRGQGKATEEPYDVKLTLIAGDEAVGISLRNSAKEVFGPYKSVELLIDRDARRVYFNPLATDEGYLVRNSENKTTIYFQCKDRKFVSFIKKLAAGKKLVSGYLKKNQEGFFIEVPE